MENGDHNSVVSEEKEVNGDLKTSNDLLHQEVFDALVKEAERRGLTDCQLDISSGTAKGDNYMGIIAKVKVTGRNVEGNEVNWDWIAKVAPQTEVYRSLLKIDLAYSREVYMYNLFYKFDEFQKEKRLNHPFNDHAKFVLSYLEPYKESLVMEDLKAVGYIMRNRKEPLDLNHVKLAMRVYGRLHAISFALRDQQPEVFKRLSKETEEKHFVVEDVEKYEEMAKYQDAMNSKIISAMHEGTDADAIESLKLYCKNSADIIVKVVNTTSQYSVIGHGDCWTNNLLWKYEDSENPQMPTKVCLLDWQLARYGSPALDLSYFLFTCTDQKFREKHYDQMIKLYYYTLCANLAEMGSDPEKLFPYSALETELKHHSVFGFYMASMVLRMMVSDSSEVPNFGESDNVDDFLNNFDYKTVHDHLYEERIRGVVLLMHQKGYFDFIKKEY